MENFIRYVAQFIPLYSRKISGATESEIAALEKLAGRILPNTYRHFLLKMGRNLGGLALWGGRYGP